MLTVTRWTVTIAIATLALFGSVLVVPSAEAACTRVRTTNGWACAGEVLVGSSGRSQTVDKGGALVSAPRPPQLGDCEYVPYQYAVSPEDPVWGGRSAADGSIQGRSCYVKYGPEPDDVGWRYAGLSFVAAGQAPPPVVFPAPSVLVSRAFGEGVLPDPSVGLGPDPDKVAVKVPVYLWVEDPGLSPTVISDDLGLISITVTPSIVETTWSPGEPVGNPDLVPTPDVVPAFVCQGRGHTGPFDIGTRRGDTSCAHTFQWRSTPDRTGGTCTWPMTVTATWNLVWSATTGDSGVLELTTSSTFPIRVREWRTLLVSRLDAQLPDMSDPRCPQS